jgi:phosphotransferase system enzyme I (PtsI)
MFPMVATLDEVDRARCLVEACQDELGDAGRGKGKKIQLGIMVEIPSVAVLADQFARNVDFFSIGTNDLTQYSMAAERGNPKVSHLCDPCHPAVLRQVQSIINAAHNQGIWVGMCGEMAGDADAIPILLGMGLDEFSMASPLIPRAKALIRQWSVHEARGLSHLALDLESAEAVRELARKTSAR